MDNKAYCSKMDNQGESAIEEISRISGGHKDTYHTFEIAQCSNTEPESDKSNSNQAISNPSFFCGCCLKDNDSITRQERTKRLKEIIDRLHCPNTKQIARLFTIILIVVLSWLIIFFLVGDTAAPGGPMFNLALMTLAALLAGKIAALFRMPGLVGMLLIGILYQNLNWVTLEGSNFVLVSKLRKLALVVILSRAGLGMDPKAFQVLYGAILRLGLIPWAVEWIVVTLLGKYWLQMPWLWALMLGCLIAAVSPAVIVPTLFRLSAEGYGVDKGVPTLIVAAAGIDDATSIAVFGILSSILFSDDSLGYRIAQVPVCIFGGAGIGFLWGFLTKWFPHVYDKHKSLLRILMLFTGGVAGVFGASYIGFEGAGPLAVVTAAFVSTIFWQKQGWNIKKNPVVDAFAFLWIILEPLLFATAGAQVKIYELNSYILLVGLGCLVIGVVVRVSSTYLIMLKGNLNLKERLFVSLSWMAKATVQAALGPVALTKLPENASVDEIYFAEIILTISILSIIVTAPLGALVISLTGPKLLNHRDPKKETETIRDEVSTADIIFSS